jgi:hypothetical protein
MARAISDAADGPGDLHDDVHDRNPPFTTPSVPNRSAVGYGVTSAGSFASHGLTPASVTGPSGWV